MKGKVTKLNLWKSGKGCFIQIDGTKPDFLFYGKTDVKVGEAVNYEIGKDAPDGKPTLKSIRADGIEAFEARDEDRAKPTQIPYRAHDAPKLDSREAYWAAKEKRDAEREPIITRLSCISSACVLLHDTGREDDALALAAKFEAFAKGEKVA